MSDRRNLVLVEALKVHQSEAAAQMLHCSDSSMLAVDTLHSAMANLQTAYELIEQVRDLAQSHSSAVVKDI